MQGRRYKIELSASLGAYAALLIISIALLKQPIGPAFWRAIIAMLPMIPGATVCWVIIRQLRRIDELQRRIQYESIATAFAATALLTFSYGFLEGIGFPRMSMFTVWPAMAFFWGACVFVNQWRYA
jgi:hypothetical protein